MGMACDVTSSDDQHSLALRDEEARLMSHVHRRMAALHACEHLPWNGLVAEDLLRLPLRREQRKDMSPGAAVRTVTDGVFGPLSCRALKRRPPEHMKGCCEGQHRLLTRPVLCSTAGVEPTCNG